MCVYACISKDYFKTNFSEFDLIENLSSKRNFLIETFDIDRWMFFVLKLIRYQLMKF